MQAHVTLLYLIVNPTVGHIYRYIYIYIHLVEHYQGRMAQMMVMATAQPAMMLRQRMTHSRKSLPGLQAGAGLSKCRTGCWRRCCNGTPIAET